MIRKWRIQNKNPKHTLEIKQRNNSISQNIKLKEQIHRLRPVNNKILGVGGGVERLQPFYGNPASPLAYAEVYNIFLVGRSSC